MVAMGGPNVGVNEFESTHGPSIDSVIAPHIPVRCSQEEPMESPLRGSLLGPSSQDTMCRRGYNILLSGTRMEKP